MIPPFDLSGVLPPFVGNDPANAVMAPYAATTVELVQRFATSPRRCQLLAGLLKYRAALADSLFTNGFQWVDGSFVENIEASGGAPSDVDIVTFFRRPPQVAPNSDWLKHFPNVQHLFTPNLTKQQFSCDAYGVDMDAPVVGTVTQTRYWFGLFSHRRVTLLWKGMIQIHLGTSLEDGQAANLLTGASQP